MVRRSVLAHMQQVHPGFRKVLRGRTCSQVLEEHHRRGGELEDGPFKTPRVRLTLKGQDPTQDSARFLRGGVCVQIGGDHHRCDADRQFQASIGTAYPQRSGIYSVPRKVLLRWDYPFMCIRIIINMVQALYFHYSNRVAVVCL